MIDILRDIRNVIYGALTGDTALMGKITGVLDIVNEQQTYPYITIGDMKAGILNCFGRDGKKITNTIHIWSNTSTYEEALSIFEDVERILDDSTLTITGNTVVDVDFESVETIAEDSGLIHIAAKFKIVAQEGTE